LAFEALALPPAAGGRQVIGTDTMSRVTRDEIIRVVGQADDVTVAEIIGTGATAEELAEAQAWAVNDDPLLNAGKKLPTGRVRELIDILAEFEPDEEHGEETGPLASEG
jgi:hypothetical protein